MDKEKSIIIITSKNILLDPILKLELSKQYDLIFCSSIINLIKLINQNKIDLLLIEVHTDGKELKTIKIIHEQFPRLPIIAIGVGKLIENLVQAFQYEIIDFFKLPYNRELLIERINVVTKKSQIKNYN